jgi:hypothetical protein
MRGFRPSSGSREPYCFDMGSRTQVSVADDDRRIVSGDRQAADILRKLHAYPVRSPVGDGSGDDSAAYL